MNKKEFNEILDSKEFTEKTENLQRESIENNDCTYIVNTLQFDYLVKLSKKYDWKKQKEEIHKECEKFNELIYSTIIKICQHENVGFLKSEGNIQSKELYTLNSLRDDLLKNMGLGE